jgi:hypothetical protein
MRGLFSRKTVPCGNASRPCEETEPKYLINEDDGPMNGFAAPRARSCV